jgi:hypothetical protein
MDHNETHLVFIKYDTIGYFQHADDILIIKTKRKAKLNFVAWVRERTIPAERPPLVSEVSANFFQ